MSDSPSISTIPNLRFPLPPRRVMMRSGRLWLWSLKGLVLSLLLAAGLWGLSISGAKFRVELAHGNAGSILASLPALLLCLFGNYILIWATASDITELIRKRQAYRHGQEAMGIIRTMRTEGEDFAAYYISYMFEDSSGRKHTPAEREIDLGTWIALRKGQPVSVLYDPDKPEDCFLYEKSDYVILANEHPSPGK